MLLLEFTAYWFTRSSAILCDAAESIVHVGRRLSRYVSPTSRESAKLRSVVSPPGTRRRGCRTVGPTGLRTRNREGVARGVRACSE